MPKSRSILLSVVTLVLGNAVQAATIYVDWTYSGIISDGTRERPFRTITEGIQNANSGDTVKILPGVYEENVVVDDNLTIIGSGPDSTVIRGHAGTSVTIRPNYNVTLEKLTVTNSNGHGMDLEKSSSSVEIVIRNIVSTGNSLSGYKQDDGCNADVELSNCTFSNNSQHGAITSWRSLFANCIATSNAQRGFTSVSTPWYNIRVRYSDAWYNPGGNFVAVEQSNCLSSDPEYVDADTGDLRLQSGSPCRWKGSPDAASRNPDGSRNDMGAYGGPGAVGFYYGYGNEPVVTDLLVTPASVPFGATFTIQATGKAQ